MNGNETTAVNMPVPCNHKVKVDIQNGLIITYCGECGTILDVKPVHLVTKILERNEPIPVDIIEEGFYSYDHGDNIDMQPSMTIKAYSCGKCHKKIRKGDNFCPNCGYKLGWEEQDE